MLWLKISILTIEILIIIYFLILIVKSKFDLLKEKHKLEIKYKKEYINYLEQELEITMNMLKELKENEREWESIIN